MSNLKEKRISTKKAVWKSNDNVLELNNNIQLFLQGEITEETLQERLTKFNEKHYHIFGEWKE